MIRRVLGMVAATLVCCGCGNDSAVEVARLDDRNVAANLRVGSTLVADGRFADAESILQRSLAFAPGDASLLVMLAEAIDGQGRTTEARRRLDEARAAGPSLAAVHILEGRWAARDKRWADAEQSYRKAVELDPHSAEARAMLGSFLWSVQRTQEAEPHLRAWAQTRSAGKLALADYYLALGKPQAAEPFLAALLPDRRLTGEVRLRRARMFYEAGRLAEADAELEHAFSSPGVEARARILRSERRLARGELDGALDDARRAVMLRPRSAAAHYAVGAAELARQDLVAAERAFKAAADLAPGSSAARMQLTRIALLRGDSDTAVRFAEQAATAAPGPAASSIWARALLSGGDRARAIQILDDAQRRWPDSSELVVERGYLQLAVGRFAAARATFERALSLAPSDASAREGLLTAHIAGGDSGAARAVVEGWRTALPQDASLALLAARIELVNGDVTAAQRLLEEFAARTPAEPAVAEALGQIFAGTGRPDAAIEEFERAAKLRGRPVAALIAIGMLNEARGNAKGAQAAYEQALAIDPEAGVAANNLAWLRAADGQVDIALTLAVKAQAALPEAPHTLHTLGWMYHLAGRNELALRWLEAAREKVPDNRLYQDDVRAASQARR